MPYQWKSSILRRNLTASSPESRTDARRIPNVSEDPGCQDGNAASLALPDKETFGGFGRKRSRVLAG